jgi:GNAT superfamily N-acetyltransferase
MQLTFRAAAREDCPLVLFFIKQLAEYEKRSGEVTATVDSLEEWLFDKHAAEVFFALLDGREIGFTLFVQNFSTFLGRAGIHLEDIFVLPEYRGHGAGTAMMRELGRIASERGYGRIDWSCLDWNDYGRRFYARLGASPPRDWMSYRIDGKSIKKLAQT